MERNSPDGVNDSGDDRTTEASSSARPLTARRPPRARVPRDANAYYDEVEDFKAVLRAIERETTEDLRAPIAVRGHLERLMEEYWSIRVAQQVQQQQSNTSDDADDTASDDAAAAAKAESLRLRILHHPNVGVAPSMMRWPLDTLAVPRPRWSLADEITTVVDRTRRLRKRSASVRDDDEDDGEEELDETPPSLTLPVITQCQAALVRLLHDVAHRDIAMGGHNKRPRRDIVTWRDVLKTIALQRHTPSAVLKATQERLEGIYDPTRDGSPSSATAAFARRFSADLAIPPPAMLAGFTASARDGLTAFLLAPSDPIPAEKSELHTDVVPGSTRKRHYEARRALNEQLLFDGRPTFVPSKSQVLAPPPVDDDDDDDLDDDDDDLDDDPDDEPSDNPDDDPGDDPDDDPDDDDDDDSDDDEDDDSDDDDDDIPEDTPPPPPAKRAR